MQPAMRGNSAGRVAYRPRRTTHHRMAVEVDYNHPYNVAIITTAIFVLIVTGLVYYSEHIWMWWLLWSDITAMVALSGTLVRRVRQGIC